MTAISRRQFVVAASVFGASHSTASRRSLAAEADQFDLNKPLQGWQTISGDWAIQNVPGARDGRALVQRATNNQFNVIVAPGGPYENVSASVRFKPMAGREDASGGIVFRYSEGRYYLIRANALEDNFRLYYYDNARRMLASATTKPPALGRWHTLRITARADHIQGWLNDQALLDHRDSRFAAGRVGLWTKADSITAFETLTVQPIEG